ncbi:MULTISPECIES: site-specific integrase [unclassified Bradyrhizobium]|uniref:tyrosine-type recombinase/integrase n=1 Tax=unclassified Bradyrhizobium TaxID=2631580 RepID=UPI0028EEDA0C|nr:MULTISPECIES: site-specific integrase [unclassified Bradyrhizobium]
MPQLQSLSEKILAGLQAPETGNVVYWAAGLKLQGHTTPAGFGVRVTSNGARAFVLNHRVDGREHRETLGRWNLNEGGGDITLLSAIIAAKVRAEELRKGIDKRTGEKVDLRPERTRKLEEVAKPVALTINDMLDQFEKKYLDEKGLRSADAYKGAFKRYVRPDIGNYSIYDIRRSHVVAMLDDIADEDEDGGGSTMRDRTLAYFRKACNWQCTRDDEFQSPIVKGMMLGTEARKRILDDQEIRDIWAALDKVKEPACYARYVKTLLLTATRRTEAAEMHSTEIDGNDWTIPAARYKTKVDTIIPLSKAALDLIGDKPEGCIGNGWFVFSTTAGAKSFSGFSKAKAALDKALVEVRQERGEMEPMKDWRLHDLRRTARTLMSKAKVLPDIAERCLGHKIVGVRGVYDQFEFLDEKRDAFEKLAGLVERILNPESNVVPLRA